MLFSFLFVVFPGLELFVGFFVEWLFSFLSLFFGQSPPPVTLEMERDWLAVNSLSLLRF